ncbi:CASP-like protein [Quillaja saponaria]|uniref:CASP-like protein n=1 Tax=Quillaja saponaria TaxID=32244 RepID=A0AAD7L247_QUISA|nr:CASP-like protein [Quillaja saponaria]
MTNIEDPGSNKHFGSPPATVTPAKSTPAETGVRNQTAGTGFGVPGILRRWRREDLIKRGYLGLRGLSLLFSLLSFIIMASNKHGDWRQFDKYEEYRYLLAIGILGTIYTGLQAWRQVQELYTGKNLFRHQTSALVDFFGDQIMAYLFISAASSAVPLTNRMREGADNIFTDSSAASISMGFLAFLCLALSAMVSGYKLSTQSYV